MILFIILVHFGDYLVTRAIPLSRFKRSRWCRKVKQGQTRTFLYDNHETKRSKHKKWHYFKTLFLAKNISKTLWTGTIYWGVLWQMATQCPWFDGCKAWPIFELVVCCSTDCLKSWLALMLSKSSTRFNFSRWLRAYRLKIKINERYTM